MQGTAKSGRRIGAVLLLALPLAAWGLAHATGVSLNDILALRGSLKLWAQSSSLAIPAYVAFYAVSVALSLPGAVVLTLLGGFLFGPLWGGLAAILGATIGACTLFILARGLLKGFFAPGAAGLAAGLARNFEANAFNYLLFLRLMPVFPFFLVNILPAFCAVSFPVFASATLLGIAPAGFAFAAIGAGLDEIVSRSGGEFSASSLATPQLWAGLAALGIISLAPVIWKAWAQRNKGNS